VGVKENLQGLCGFLGWSDLAGFVGKCGCLPLATFSINLKNPMRKIVFIFLMTGFLSGEAQVFMGRIAYPIGFNGNSGVIGADLGYLQKVGVYGVSFHGAYNMFHAFESKNVNAFSGELGIYYNVAISANGGGTSYIRVGYGGMQNSQVQGSGITLEVGTTTFYPSISENIGMNIAWRHYWLGELNATTTASPDKKFGFLMLGFGFRLKYERKITIR